MKLYLALGLLILASCDVYDGTEFLQLNLAPSYDSVRPSFSYRLGGSDTLLGLVKVYKLTQPEGEKELVEGFETYLSPSGGDFKTFQFNRALASGVYLMHSTLVVKRAGTLSERIGSAREAFFSITPTPVTTPQFQLYTDKRTSKLGLLLKHPHFTPQWGDNPTKFYFNSTINTSDGSNPPAPGDPSTGSTYWDASKGDIFFNDVITGYQSIWVKALGSYGGGSTLSSIADFSYSFKLNVLEVKNSLDYSMDTAVNGLKKSQPGEMRIKAEWKLLNEVANAAHSDLQISLVNRYNGSAARLSLPSSIQSTPYVGSTVLSLFPTKDELAFLSSTLGGNPSDPNCYLIFAILDKAYGVFLIYVTE